MSELEEAADREAIERLAQEHREGRRQIEITLGRWEAWLCLTAIQLTVTHPNVEGELRKMLLELGRQIQVVFDGRLAVIAERGWHREYDRRPR